MNFLFIWMVVAQIGILGFMIKLLKIKRPSILITLGFINVALSSFVLGSMAIEKFNYLTIYFVITYGVLNPGVQTLFIREYKERMFFEKK